jgi:hypothetical protein
MVTNTTRRPLNPYWVLIAGALLPGSGHVMLGLSTRGLFFVLFIILLGWVSVNLMPPHSSFFGRHIGGIFVYGLSVIDAYKSARVKWEQWKFVAAGGTPMSQD